MMTQIENARTDVYFTTAEAAEILKVCTKTMQNWRKTGRGPSWYKVTAKSIRYDAKSVLSQVQKPEEKQEEKQSR